MTAADRNTIRHHLDQAARTEVCPACGHWCRYLHPKTGFCQACTYEVWRGGPVNPHDHLKT